MASEIPSPISTPTNMPSRKLPPERLRIAGGVWGLAIYIFSGALTPKSDRPLASVWRTAALSASLDENALGIIVAVEFSRELAQVEGERVRRPLARRRQDQLRELREPLRKQQLSVAFQGLKRQVFRKIPPPNLRENAAHPRVRGLHVVHRVVAGFALGEVEIEVEVLVAFAQHVEKARRVVPHLLAQLAQRDEFARALAHRHFLAVAVEHGELHQRDLEPARVQAESLERSLHARHVAVVVGAPDVDHAVEAALELVEVVGDVGGEISVLAVLAPHHPVLLVAERARSKPQCAALLEQVPARLQELEGLVDQAVVVKRLL